MVIGVAMCLSPLASLPGTERLAIAGAHLDTAQLTAIRDALGLERVGKQQMDGGVQGRCNKMKAYSRSISLLFEQGFCQVYQICTGKLQGCIESKMWTKRW
jgi:hypothetical protein